MQAETNVDRKRRFPIAFCSFLFRLDYKFATLVVVRLIEQYKTVFAFLLVTFDVREGLPVYRPAPARMVREQAEVGSKLLRRYARGVRKVTTIQQLRPTTHTC